MIKFHKCAQPRDSSSQSVDFQTVYEVTYGTCLQESEGAVKVVKLQGHDVRTHNFTTSCRILSN